MKQEVFKLNVITQLHVLSYVPSFTDIISETSIELYWLKLIICGSNEADTDFLSDMRRHMFIRTLLKVCYSLSTFYLIISLMGISFLFINKILHSYLIS